jgi:hypothetical protein
MKLKKFKTGDQDENGVKLRRSFKNLARVKLN